MLNCGTKANLPRNASLLGTASPAINTSPLRDDNPSIARTSVVLPHPEGPITALSACGLKRAFARSKIRVPPGVSSTERSLQDNIRKKGHYAAARPPHQPRITTVK